jgi:hypothetical protein
MIKEFIAVMLVVVIILALIDLKPYIDKTSNGSIVIWYNNNDKRTFKYLWKRNT